MNYLAQCLGVLIWLSSFSFIQAKTPAFLSETDSSGIELKHLIGKHLMKRFTVEDGVARFKVGKGKTWQDFEVRGFQPRPIQMQNSYTAQTDELNGVTLRVSVTITGTAHRIKEGRTWSDWKPGPPGQLVWASITIVRKDGKFELTESMGADRIKKVDTRPNRGIQKL